MPRLPLCQKPPSWKGTSLGFEPDMGCWSPPAGCSGSRAKDLSVHVPVLSQKETPSSKGEVWGRAEESPHERSGTPHFTDEKTKAQRLIESHPRGLSRWTHGFWCPGADRGERLAPHPPLPWKLNWLCRHLTHILPRNTSHLPARPRATTPTWASQGSPSNEAEEPNRWEKA